MASPQLRTIKHVYLCDDDTGEVEGMFDENGKLLGAWSCNDGSWRGEYFDNFLLELGIKVEYPDDNEKLKEKLKEACSCE